MTRNLAQKILDDQTSSNKKVLYRNDNSLKYWNTKGELKHDNIQFRGWVSCILNNEKGKSHFIIVRCWDGSVKLLNSEYNIVLFSPFS